MIENNKYDLIIIVYYTLTIILKNDYIDDFWLFGDILY